jgi:ApaG protein
MIQQITKGIMISVETHFEGTFHKENEVHYAFSYKIIIENKSTHTTQLNSRKWVILDALNNEEIVIGDGVIGEQPILYPGENYSYKSGCVLKAPFGAMRGSYTMLNFEDSTMFNVIIPTFKLSAEFAQN